MTYFNRSKFISDFNNNNKSLKTPKREIPKHIKTIGDTLNYLITEEIRKYQNK